MDPLSVLGAGLGSASLMLQIFAGCVQGYTLFCEAVDMPDKYRHLRTRLRIEQSRLLNWGEQVGIIEELLDNTSNTLKLHRNLVMDILFEVQSVFKSTITITTKYDPFIRKSVGATEPPGHKQRSEFLRKVLSVVNSPSHTVAALQWSAIKHDKFEQLINQLVVFNDRIESLLDRSSLSELKTMQERSNLMLLQLTSQVEELRAISAAMQISRSHVRGQTNGLSRSSTLVEDIDEVQPLAVLADFKAQYIQLTTAMQKGRAMEIDSAKIDFERNRLRQIETTNNSHSCGIWIEWLDSIQDVQAYSELRDVIESRVEKLANLLSIDSKPEEFRAPQCLGYVKGSTTRSDLIRYGLVFDASLYTANPTVSPTSLRDLFHSTVNPPSLSDRIKVARMLAESLLYLHAVDWIHKGVRSTSVLFFNDKLKPSKTLDLSKPVLSGFDFARPDLPDEITFRNTSEIEHNLYRHPELLQFSTTRSQKHHDIYGLGIVMIELAFWQPIEDIMDIRIGEKGTNRRIAKIRGRLLDTSDDGEDWMGAIRARSGQLFADVVQVCLEGGEQLGVGKGVDDMKKAGGAGLQEAFQEQVIVPLQNIRI